MTLEKDLLRLVPVTVLLRALQVRTVVSVQVLEDPVLVPQATVRPLWWRILYCRERPLLCAVLGGGSRKAGSCRSCGQRSVGGRTERRRGRCVSCEHRDCCMCVVERN